MKRKINAIDKHLKNKPIKDEYTLLQDKVYSKMSEADLRLLVSYLEDGIQDPRIQIILDELRGAGIEI